MKSPMPTTAAPVEKSEAAKSSVVTRTAALVAHRVVLRESTDLQARVLEAYWRLPISRYTTLGGRSALYGVYLGHQRLCQELTLLAPDLILSRFGDLISHLPGGFLVEAAPEAGMYRLRDQGSSGIGKSMRGMTIRILYRAADLHRAEIHQFRAWDTGEGAARTATVRAQAFPQVLSTLLEEIGEAVKKRREPLAPVDALDLYYGLKEAARFQADLPAALGRRVVEQDAAPNLLGALHAPRLIEEWQGGLRGFVVPAPDPITVRDFLLEWLQGAVFAGG